MLDLLHMNGTTMLYKSPGPGLVKLYHYDIAKKVWTNLGNDLIGKADGDWFGWSVAMSVNGRRLAVSAACADNNKGYVQVLDYDGKAKLWSQVGQIIVGQGNTLVGYRYS